MRDAEIGHSACPDMMLAAISQRTTRLRLGFGVIVLPCHHPFQVAERVATLDVLSSGRAEFGFGRGTAGHITEGFGVSTVYAGESLAAVISMLTEERFPGFRGELFELPQGRCSRDRCSARFRRSKLPRRTSARRNTPDGRMASV